MWSLFNKAPNAPTTGDTSVRRALTFETLMEGLGPLTELATHDMAVKLWLPEPAERALKEISSLQGVTMSAMLRDFLATHCYGIYVVQLLRNRDPNCFRDSDTGIRFSKARGERKIRKVTYWIPELGKNVAPVKIWVAKRLRDDLQALADHTSIPLSQYLREITISRLLGHGMLPKRPEMLEAAPLPSADNWCDDKDVPWVEVDEETYYRSSEGRKDVTWED